MEQLETNPSKYLPEVQEKDLTTEVVQVCQSYCSFKNHRGNYYHMSILMDCFTAQLHVKYKNILITGINFCFISYFRSI